MRTLVRRFLLWATREPLSPLPPEAFPVPTVDGALLHRGYRVKDGDAVDAVLLNFMLERIDRLEGRRG